MTVEMERHSRAQAFISENFLFQKFAHVLEQQQSFSNLDRLLK